MAFYSQHGEDRIAAEILRGKTGAYLDIGAHDGVNLSNTYHFYKRGWRGICVEPHPDYFAKLIASRPDDVCLQVAVDERSSEAAILHTTPIGAFSGIRLTDEMVGRVAGEARAGGWAWHGHGSTTVEVRSAADILAEHPLPSLQLLSVDVEGIEADILRGFPFGAYRPRLVIVEHNDRDAVLQVMTDANYFYAGEIGVNGLYVWTLDDLATVTAILRGD